MQRTIGFCLVLICFAVSTQAKYLDENIDYAQDRFIVKLWPDVEDLEPVVNGVSVKVSDSDLTALNYKWQIIRVERLFKGPPTKEALEFDLPGYWRFWLAEPVDLETALSEYEAVSIVHHVEPIGIHRIYYTPNDPSWPSQWYIRNNEGDHDIDAVEGWDIERGDTLAILGIVDTGVQYMHPDLQGNMWRNLSELYGTSGVDDDSNGFIDDSVGWDFVTGISDVWTGEDGSDEDNDPKDFNGHGTHCSGIAAAQTNNGLGVAGIAGGGTGYLGARILAARVGWTSSEGYGYVRMDFCAQAIDYARQKGVCAINCSWGSSSNGGLVAAVDAAVAAGVVFCVAAGNSNSSSSDYMGSRGDCIDIAATNSEDIRAGFSNYGEWVDVSAPGVNVYSTYSNQYQNTYEYLSGTSMAAPCVTGEVGLLKSRNPEWSREEITTTILENVDNIYDENSGWEGLLGSGRINVNLALLSTATITILQPNGGEVWTLGEIDTIRWISEGYSGDVNFLINYSYPWGPWQNLANNVPNTGEYAWEVTLPTTTSARIRVFAATSATIGDTSDANFSIVPASITVDYPNGGENFCAGQTETITWSGTGIGGLVTVSLNRDYPSGSWEPLFSHTPNDGIVYWDVNGTASTTARIRIISDSESILGDTSDADFTIESPCIELTSPQGGEAWEIGEDQTIRWISAEITGNVEIAINRDYPAGAWEVLFDDTPSDGEEVWSVMGPTSLNNRIRIKSINESDVFDICEDDFWIIESNEPPQIVHDPFHDSWEPEATITAIVTDDSLPETFGVQLFYRIEGTPNYSRTIMEPTGYPDEYAAYVSSLENGRYEYYIRAVDMLSASDSTQILNFDVGSSCEVEMAFDDGEGERFDWMEDTRFKWAVKFSPASFPFVLCGAQFSVAHSEPDSSHEPVFVEVFDDNNGVPGELIYTGITGSVGNIIGGLPAGAPLWAEVVTVEDGILSILDTDFFIAVSNPDSSGYEAFARDTTGENSGRSFFYDPSDSEWHNENDAVPNAHPGNRLIRANGYIIQSPDSFALLSPDDGDTVWTITPTLDWEDASSSNPDDTIHYALYWSPDSSFAQDVDSAVTDSSSYSFTEDEISDDVTLYWKVRAENLLGLTRWGEPETGWSFVVFEREAPNPFHLITPVDGSVIDQLEITVTWQATTDPDPGDSVIFYRVYLAEDSVFSQADSQDVPGTSTWITDLEFAQTYWWKVHAFDSYGLWESSIETWFFSTPSSTPEGASGIPEYFAMEQNYPNPFNPSTTIRIAVPRQSKVAVEIYDILGRRVAELAKGEFNPGYHTLSWSCQTCAAGIYFVQMRAEDFTETRKMLIVK